jgi:hypothetical protein
MDRTASDGGDLGCRYTPETVKMVQKTLKLRANGIIKFRVAPRSHSSFSRKPKARVFSSTAFQKFVGHETHGSRPRTGARSTRIPGKRDIPLSSPITDGFTKRCTSRYL